MKNVLKFLLDSKMFLPIIGKTFVELSVLLTIDVIRDWFSFVKFLILLWQFF